MSSKFECGQCLMNSPHVLVFSNSEPEYSAVSFDRWRVTCIGEEEEPVDLEEEKEECDSAKELTKAEMEEMVAKAGCECVSAFKSRIVDMASNMLELRSRSVNKVELQISD